MVRWDESCSRLLFHAFHTWLSFHINTREVSFITITIDIWMIRAVLQSSYPSWSPSPSSWPSSCSAPRPRKSGRQSYLLSNTFKGMLVRAKSQSMQLTRLQIIITGGRRALQLGGNGRHHLHYLDRHQLPGTCHWPGFKFFLENGWICWITTSQRFWSAAFSSLQNAFTHCLTYFGSLASTTSLLGSF